MVRTKVFVGNLDFKTKETELAKAFGAAGKVISANIITRGSRSLGYGFVEMENEEDANKAVQLLNKQELDGRPINVEVAKPRDETAVANQQQQQPQQGGEGQQQFQRVGGARGGRGRGSRRGGRGGATAAPRDETASPRGAAPRGRGGFRRRGFGGRGPRTEGQAEGGQPQQQQPDNRTPSKTTLFVANLPFKLDDEGFTKALKDNSVAFKSAYVVKNQRSGRSKGFGFIEFENESDQQKGLTALDKKVVEERELVVKVALTEAATANKPEAAPASPAVTKQ
jgi:RNA recognition motif-containing protein